MDDSGYIYESEEIPEKDATRLEGYLKGRAESDKMRREEAEAFAEELYAIQEQIDSKNESKNRRSS